MAEFYTASTPARNFAQKVTTVSAELLHAESHVGKVVVIIFALWVAQSPVIPASCRVRGNVTTTNVQFLVDR